MKNILYSAILITSFTCISALAQSKPAIRCKANEVAGLDGVMPKFRPLILAAATAMSSKTGQERDLNIEVVEDDFTLSSAQSDEVITLNFVNQNGTSFAFQRWPHQNEVTIFAYLDSLTITSTGRDDASFSINSPRMTTLSCVSHLAAKK